MVERLHDWPHVSVSGFMVGLVGRALFFERLKKRHQTPSLISLTGRGQSHSWYTCWFPGLTSSWEGKNQGCEKSKRYGIDELAACWFIGLFSVVVCNTFSVRLLGSCQLNIQLKFLRPYIFYHDLASKKECFLQRFPKPNLVKGFSICQSSFEVFPPEQYH